MNRTQQQEILDEEINLLDYWRMLVKQKRLIWSVVGIAFVTSVIVSLLLPKMYASTASLLPPRQEDSLNSSIASRLSGGLGGFVSGFIGAGAPSDIWVGILESRTVMDGVIVGLNLKELYEEESLEGARARLKKRVKIKKSKNEMIYITVEDRDPQMAAQMANTFVEELDRINKGVVMTSGKSMRVFVEDRLTKVKAELVNAEDTLKTFQEKNKAFKLDDQSKAMIETISTVKGQLMAKELELETLLSYATLNHPQAGILKTQIIDLNETLKELEVGRKGESPPFMDIFIPVARIPDTALRYGRLLRDVKIQLTLYELLTQQYEMARIQEAKDSPTVQVLDVAEAAENKSKPRRVRIVLFSTIAAIFFAVFLAVFMENMRSVKETKG